MSSKLIAGLLAGIAATAALAQPAPPPAGQPGRPGMQRTETRADVVQRTQAMFARLDSNRDGAITQDELPAMGDRAERAPGGPAAAPAPGAGHEQRGDEMFARMDLNHDGMISRAEFDQAHAQMAAMHGAHSAMADGPGGPGMDVMPGMAGGEQGGRGMRGGGIGGRLLMMADANRDGRVTLPEMTAAALQRFDRMDLNHDGTVTPDERAQARQQWGAERRN